MRQDTSIADESGSLVTHSKSKSVKSGGLFSVANNFRLWITTQSDVGRLIPGMYILNLVYISFCNFLAILQSDGICYVVMFINI